MLLETDVRRSDFVVIFFQLTQNWTALNFEVNFRPLIQWDSRGLFSKSLMKLDDRLMTSKSERQRTSGPQKRSKSDGEKNPVSRCRKKGKKREQKH